MSHLEQQAFIAAVVAANHEVIAGSRILEIGSYDVNGTMRRLFADAADYVGVDLTEGPGVDRVLFGHEVADSNGSFDLTVSGECFEHDVHWEKTFTNMVRLTRSGGLVTFTCASKGRPEHGTARTNPTMSPGTQSLGSDYYRNLERSDFSHLPLADWFETWSFWEVPTSFDLYFAGVRAGTSTGARAALPDDDDVAAISSIMRWRAKMVRWPLRIAVWHGERETYQSRALVYWRWVTRFSAPTKTLIPRSLQRDMS